MDEKLVAALVGGFTSLVVALLGQIFNPLAQKRLERYKSNMQAQMELQKADFQKQLELEKSRAQTELEALKADLADRGNARSARRDYEYEARKRLYAEVEPLFFTLYEASEECYYRIRSLVRSAHEGRLGTGKESWIDHDGYYLVSTAFKLLLPSTIHSLIQRRLTFIDLRLDELVRLRYLIVKNFVHSFTDHFDFATLMPPLAYNPARAGDAYSTEDRPIRRRQGIITGDLENLVDEMVAREPAGLRAVSFSEFEKRSKIENEGSYLRVILDLYRGFSPRTDPILARMLLAQAGLSHLFMNTFKGADSIEALRRSLGEFCSSEEARVYLNWNKAGGTTENIKTVEPYLSSCLDWIEAAP